ncbi:MAG: ParB/RepB/Spo0J family partition protein [Peptococcaceae bacterium]|nr:ParB/RepB/Spo0J family partition protein [Peptococcaceae bacterium]
MAIDAVSKFFGNHKEGGSQEQVLALDLNLLTPNPYQPRKAFDEGQLEEMGKSMREIGVIQPIVVRRSGERYELVAGERRFRAAKLIGMTTIPAVIRNFTDKEMATIALVENLQRADLNYFEEAEGFQRLIEEFGMTQEEVAARVGKSQPTVANKLRVLRLDPQVREKIIAGVVTERHARALLKLGAVEEQLLILKEIYDKELNVKDTEYLVGELLAGRAEIGEDGDEENDPAAPKKRTLVRRMSPDMRIYINTIQQAVKTIREAGQTAEVEQTETDDFILLTIRLPRVKRQGDEGK